MTDTRPQTAPAREQAQALFYDLEQQACAVSALGSLLRVANHEKIDEYVPHGVGVLLEFIASKMFETMDKGIEVCSLRQQVSDPT